MIGRIGHGGRGPSPAWEASATAQATDFLVFFGRNQVSTPTTATTPMMVYVVERLTLNNHTLTA
jgi:hypothetical protein